MASANESEIERLQGIVDKYKAGPNISTGSKRAVIKDFVLWLAKENIALANRTDLYTYREAMDLIETYLKEKHNG